MQTKYELQKKENLIIRQTLDINRKNYLFYGLLLLSFFAGVVAWLIFNGYRRKQKIKLGQMQEEEKLLSTLAIIKAEEAERKRIAADLHDNLGAYAASIASNIEHITISLADTGNSVAMQELRNNSQAIVSQLSDTIWVLKKNALSLTAISDRLKVFIQRIQPSYPAVTIDVIEKIETDHLLPPSQAFHLYPGITGSY
jgi:signal transduction histidine kinase